MVSLGYLGRVGNKRLIIGLLVLRDGGSSYKMYVFKESTRRYTIDCKGRGRKEVIYLRVANVSYTRGVYKSTGLLL